MHAHTAIGRDGPDERIRLKRVGQQPTALVKFGEHRVIALQIVQSSRRW